MRLRVHYCPVTAPILDIVGVKASFTYPVYYYPRCIVREGIERNMFIDWSVLFFKFLSFIFVIQNNYIHVGELVPMHIKS